MTVFVHNIKLILAQTVILLIIFFFYLKIIVWQFLANTCDFFKDGSSEKRLLAKKNFKDIYRSMLGCIIKR